MKLAICSILLLWAFWAKAADVLVLISPERAGPGAFIDSTPHGHWVLWPPASTSDGSNRILSLFTGLDWTGEASDLSVRYQAGIPLLTSFESLRGRGYFEAKGRIVDRQFYCLKDGRGNVSPLAAAVAALGRDAGVRTIGLQDAWPKGAVIVTEATSWDSVARISRKAAGRVLIIEFPPMHDRTWSKFYLRGKGWHSGIPVASKSNVAGLMPARDVGSLLLHPEKFEWRDDDSANWGGANRWLGFVHYSSVTGEVLAALVFSFFFGATVYLLSRQEKARFAGTALRALTLIPAAVLATGQICWMAGQSLVWVVFPALIFLLGTAAAALKVALERALPGSHPLLATAILGFAVTVLCPPTWSFYSNELGYNVFPVSPEGLAAFLTYLASVVVLARGNRVATWCTATIALGLVPVGLWLQPWWCGDSRTIALMPALLLLASSHRIKFWLLAGAVVLGVTDGRIFHGFAWVPGDLLTNLGQSESINAARHVQFLGSPGWIGAVLIAGVLALFVENYFWHALKRVWRRETRLRFLTQCTVAIAFAALLEPLLLQSALMLLIGAAVVALTDSSWTF